MDGEKRLTSMLKWLGTVLLSVALLWVVITALERIEAIVLIILAAIVVAYVLYPPVHFLEIRRLPRWGAILTVYTVLAIIVVASVSFGGPALMLQLRNFSNDLPRIVGQFHNFLLNAHNAAVAAVPVETRQSMANYIDHAFLDLQNSATMFAGKAVQIVLSVVSVISAFVIIPILGFYILLDADNLVEGFVHLFPAKHQNRVTLVLHDVDHVLGAFFRGQIIVAAFVAIAASVALLLLHVQYAVIIGIFAGIVDMIPYVGAIAGAIPAVIIALVTHGIISALLVVAAFTVVYQIEGHFVAPNIVGKRVGLSPLFVIVSILIGAEVGGIVGMFVAVPLAATVRMVWRRLAHPLEVSPPQIVSTAEDPGDTTKIAVVTH